MNGVAEAPRLLQIWQSFRALPRWVQVWVGLILVPANAVPFALLDTWTGRIAAVAAFAVVATNLPIMWIERGMSRLMSVPYLLIWGPLQVGLLLRWTAGAGSAARGTFPVKGHRFDERADQLHPSRLGRRDRDG